MNLTDDQRTEALDALTDDGDTIALVIDGRSCLLRLHIQPDDSYFSDIAEMGDCYGRTAYAEGWRNDHGYKLRPDGFDGSARKLHYGRGDSVWWQPPDDLKGDREATDRLATLVRDICEYGFVVVGVSLHETVTDSYGGEHVVEIAAAWIGGVEPDPDRDYIRSLVSDLIADLPGGENAS